MIRRAIVARPCLLYAGAWLGLKNFAKFTEKHLCWSLFLLKLQPSGLKCFFKRLQHRRFPVSFAKFLRTPILQHTSEQLLLKFKKYLFLGSLFVSLDKSVSANAIYRILFAWRSKNFVLLLFVLNLWSMAFLKTAEVLFSSFVSSFQKTIISMIESVLTFVTLLHKSSIRDV